MNVFDRLGEFGFIHHRALNRPQLLNEARALAQKHPGLPHIVEGDLCWNMAEGRDDLYFRHPSLVFDSLSSRQIDEAVAAGKLVRLEDLAAFRDENVTLIVELKVGRGDQYKALDKLLGFLETHFPGRYWIDGFSLRLLRYIKKRTPQAPVTLHTELVFAGQLLIGAPEFFPYKFIRLDRLDEIDGVAIRWRFSDAFMRNASQSVRRRGLQLVLSRIHDERQYRLARQWRARAGYVHGDLEALFAMEPEIRRGLSQRA